MALYFSRDESGWTDVHELRDGYVTPEGWTRVVPHQDDVLLAQLAAPLPMKKWRAHLVYMIGSRGYRTTHRYVEGEAPGRMEAMAQIQALHGHKRGFYIAELHEVVQPTTELGEALCRATVTI